MQANNFGNAGLVLALDGNISTFQRAGTSHLPWFCPMRACHDPATLACKLKQLVCTSSSAPALGAGSQAMVSEFGVHPHANCTRRNKWKKNVLALPGRLRGTQLVLTISQNAEPTLHSMHRAASQLISTAS